MTTRPTALRRRVAIAVAGVVVVATAIALGDRAPRETTRDERGGSPDAAVGAPRPPPALARIERTTATRSSHPDVTLREATSLIVRVVDLAGEPVGDAVVVSVGQEGQEDRAPSSSEGGVWRFDGIPPGEWDVRSRSREFFPTDSRITVLEGGTHEHEIRVDPGVAIEGIVVDENGAGVPGAGVRVDMRRRAKDGVADATGRFRVAALPSETEVHVSAWRPAALVLTRTLAFVVVTSPAVGVRLVIVRLGSAKLLVRRPEGAPYSGPASLTRTADGSTTMSSIAIENGAVVLDGLGEGRVSLAVRVDGFAPIVRSFDPVMRTDVDLGSATLGPGVTLTGRVVDVDGSGVSGARVDSDGDDADAISTDERGRFVLARLPRERQTLTVGAEGFLGVEVVVGPPTGAPLEVRLARGGLVRVRLVGDTEELESGFVAAHSLRPDGTREELHPRLVCASFGSAQLRLPAGRWAIVFASSSVFGPSSIAIVTLGEGDVEDLEYVVPTK